MKRILPLALVMLMAVAFAPKASALGVYVGGSYGNAGVEVDDFDEDDSAYKVFGGVRLLKFLAFEASYDDFGEAETSGVSADTSAWGLFARGHFPIWRFEIFGKVGVYQWESDVDVGNASDSFDGSELAYGAGASFRITDLIHIRGEYETFDLDDNDLDGDLEMYSLGVEFRFLGN